MTNLRLGEGVSGKAVAEGRVIHVGDYLEGEFRHDDLVDSLVERPGSATSSSRRSSATRARSAPSRS